MKPRFAFIAGLGALALGFASGFLTAPGEAGAARQSAPRITPAASQGEKLPAELAQQLQNFGYDERITRLFSSQQQRVQLFRKYELSEALRGLTAKDMGG